MDRNEIAYIIVGIGLPLLFLFSMAYMFVG
jgi:hypothetical protein